MPRAATVLRVAGVLVLSVGAFLAGAPPASAVMLPAGAVVRGGTAQVAAWAAPASAARVNAAARMARGAGRIAGAQRPRVRLKPVVRSAVRHDTSPPLRRLKPLRGRVGKKVTTVPLPPVPHAVGGAGRGGTADVQRAAAVTAGSMPAFGQNFEGVGNLDNVLPPDTNGAVGPNDYVQTVNTSFAVYSKQGGLLLGPVKLSTLWQGFGGQCDPSVDAAADGGDPVVLYDEMANRWIISQLAFPQLQLGAGGFHECIAVSQTPDPTGAYFRYDFFFSADTLNDYPKLGVWPDAYYMSSNDFLGGSSFTGVTVTAFDRAQMLAGQPATSVQFTIGSQYSSLLPSNTEGGAIGQDPPAGAPNPFFMSCDAANGGPCTSDQLDEWDFHVDWANPASSTFGNGGAPTTTIPVAAFDSNLCNFGRDCIPQPGTGQGLDAVSDRLMYQAAYRNLGGGTQAVVLNQTVNVSPNPATSPQAGVRWYELANTGSGWSVSQQGTYAPDSGNRWMGSANIDASGDLALGYSVSSSATFPSIRVAGRLAGDPAGQLAQGEATLMAGAGSQTSGFARWGDYSAMQVDPADGCTLWYTSEYLPATSNASWHTRIGSFNFPSCTATSPHGTLAGTVTDASTGNPIARATISTPLASTVTDGQGHYSLVLPPGSYDVTATAPGFGSKTTTGVSVTGGATTTADIALTPLPTTTVSGTVTDGSGHGWPLYAKITIDGFHGGAIFTNPFTGHYSVKLLQQATVTMHVAPVYEPGYLGQTVQFSTGTDSSLTQNAALAADLTACQAPGYGFNGLSEDFTGWTGATPRDGWAVQSSTAHGWQFNNPGSRPSPPGGDAQFAVADSNFYAHTRMSTTLVSPLINLSGQSAPEVSFGTAYYAKPKGEAASVDLSLDGGSTWATIWRQTTTNAIGHIDLPIPQAANHSAVRVRFHYTASNAWWWAIDNIFAGTHTCVPVPGGLVEGFVTDTTGQPLVGAIVTSNDRPAEFVVTVENPDDPNLPRGFYWLFSSLTGAHPFTASDTGHTPATATVTIAPGQVTRHDWALTPSG